MIKRGYHTAKLKAKVAVEALREGQTTFFTATAVNSVPAKLMLFARNPDVT